MVATLQDPLWLGPKLRESILLDQYIAKEELQRLLPQLYKRHPEKLTRIRHGLPRRADAVWQHGVPARDGEIFRLVLESANSDWQQLVTLETDRTLSVDGKVYRRGVMVDYKSNLQEKVITVRTREGMLWVWNAWRHRRSGTAGPWYLESLSNHSGMIVETLPDGFRYSCNEGRDDDDYDDLVFRIERIGMAAASPAKITRQAELVERH